MRLSHAILVLCLLNPFLSQLFLHIHFDATSRVVRFKNKSSFPFNLVQSFIKQKCLFFFGVLLFYQLNKDSSKWLISTPEFLSLEPRCGKIILWEKKCSVPRIKIYPIFKLLYSVTFKFTFSQVEFYKDSIES